MNLKIEITEEKQKALIVSTQRYSIIKKLEKKLSSFSIEVFFSSEIPPKLNSFDYLFFIQPEEKWLHKVKNYKKKIIFIFLNNKKVKNIKSLLHLKNIKIIKTNASDLNDNEIDKALWFVLSPNQESILNLYSLKEKKLESNKKDYLFSKINFFFSKKLIFKTIIFFFIFLHLLFFLPLFLSSFYGYQAYKNLKREETNNLKTQLKKQAIFLKLAQKTYSLVKPTYLFLSIDNLPTNIIDINEKSCQLINKTLETQERFKNVINFIFKKNKKLDEEKTLLEEIKVIKNNIDTIEENLILISNKLPQNLSLFKNLKNKILSYLELISQVKKLTPFVEELFAENSEKKYLILFANNMELRPGGGFIGSFGVLDIKNLTIQNLRIYDVYDADGQLKAHLEPPLAIKKYLNQPHWFLRDSAFSPDFLENYTQAKIFLKKEIGFDNFNGVIFLTTSAVENILDAFGDLYLPDYKETINKKNFYLKTQYYTEKNFFPGSIQKKSFLSSLANQILINLENASFKKLLPAIKKSLDEKQMVIYFDNLPKLQKIIDSFFWSGRVIEPTCINKVENCLTDFLMPIDANLGVNKANFYINHFINLKTWFNNQGQIRHLLSIVFKNNSPSTIFPGGIYKNYFQLFLPNEVIINQITKDGIIIEKEKIDFENINDKIQKIGFLVIVPVKSTTEIKIDYELKEKFKKGRGVYQLIIQKQIGTDNIDFVMETYLPENFYLIGQNYIPLVKDNQIIYNTNLSADKIFITELIKD